MNETLCRNFVFHFDKKMNLAIGKAPRQFQKWLSEQGIPLGLFRFLIWYWPQKDCEIGLCNILSSESIHSHDATTTLLRFKLLNVGNAINGDWIVIDFSDAACAPGYLPFALWNAYATEPTDPRGLFQPISHSLDSCLYRLVEGLYLPCDSYEAENFNEFLRAEYGPRQAAPPNPYLPYSFDDFASNLE